MSDSRAVVVIPIYRAEPDAVERASLERCRSVLGGHPIRLVCPESLDVSAYQAFAHALDDGLWALVRLGAAGRIV